MSKDRMDIKSAVFSILKTKPLIKSYEVNIIKTDRINNSIQTEIKIKPVQKNQIEEMELK